MCFMVMSGNEFLSGEGGAAGREYV
jgi:hypothetical protein